MKTITTKEAKITYEVTQDMIDIDEDGNEIFSEEYVLIDGLYVAPEHRGKGKAKEMLETAIQEASALGISTLKIVASPQEDNVSADELVKLYKKFGFVECEGQESQEIILEKNI